MNDDEAMEMWGEGKDAYRKGIPRRENPNPPGTRDARFWAKGWRDEEQLQERLAGML